MLNLESTNWNFSPQFELKQNLMFEKDLVYVFARLYRLDVRLLSKLQVRVLTVENRPDADCEE